MYVHVHYATGSPFLRGITEYIYRWCDYGYCKSSVGNALFRYTQKQKGMDLEMNQNLPSIVPEKKGWLVCATPGAGKRRQIQKSQSSLVIWLVLAGDGEDRVLEDVELRAWGTVRGKPREREGH